jgi:hypothetical protein
VLTSNGTKDLEKIALTDEASTPPGKAVGGALIDGDIVTVHLEQYGREQSSKRASDYSNFQRSHLLFPTLQ